MLWLGFVVVLALVAGLFWLLGFWRWLAMAASFLAKLNISEQWHLLILRCKLKVLKAIAHEIGKVERQITK